MSDRYKQVVRAVTGTPWAILEDKLIDITDLIGLRAAGERFTDEEIQARIGSPPVRRPDTQMAGNVAVIPLYGAITPKADLMTAISGGTSVQSFQAAFRTALADKTVSAIVIDCDTPGGSTDLMTEMAAEIRAARGRGKPIVACINATCCSAGYWLASQADEIVSTPSGKTGSVGVFGVHQDISGAQEQDGVKTTLISAGKHKTQGNPFEPLSAEARASIQARIDETYSTFVSDIAKGRRVPVDTVRNGYGEGDIVTVKQALSEGMIDRIDTLEATVQRVGRSVAQTRNGSAAMATGTVLIREGETWTPVHATGPPLSLSYTNTEAAASGLFYAPIGASLAEEGAALSAAATDYIDRVSSLGEARRGALTAPKREALAAVAAAFREATEAAERLLAATDPDHVRKAGTKALAALALLQDTA